MLQLTAAIPYTHLKLHTLHTWHKPSFSSEFSHRLAQLFPVNSYVSFSCSSDLSFRDFVSQKILIEELLIIGWSLMYVKAQQANPIRNSILVCSLSA